MKKSFVVLLLCALTLISAASGVYSAPQAPKEEESLYLAQKAIDDGFYDVALSMLEKFIKNYPQSERIPQAQLLVGRCYFHQNKFLDALERFTELSRQPNAASIRDAVTYWIAEVHFRGNNFSQAATFYKSIIDTFPKSSYVPSAYYSLGWCLFQEGKFKEALDYFLIVEERYSAEPQYQDVYMKIMECLYNLKDYAALKQKVTVYQKSLQKDPEKLAYLNFYLGESEYYLNNFLPALDAYGKVIVKPIDQKLTALAKLGMAWSHIRLKQYEKADALFKEIDSQQMDSRARDVLSLGRALLKYEQQDFASARRLYEELLNATTDSAMAIQAYLGQADSSYNLNDFATAQELYAKGLEEAQKGSPASEIVDKLHYGRAWAFFKQENYKEAIQEFQKIVRHSEDRVVKISALCQIGDAYQESGDYEKAQQTYDRILVEYPDSLYTDYVQYQLGLTLLKTSNYDGAIVSFSTLKRNFPNSKLLDDATYALGLAYFQKQDYATAADILRDFPDEFKDSSISAEATYLLGSSLYNQAAYAQAIEIFKNIIRLYGANQELVQKAEYEIADCYYQMGDENEAMNRFRALRTKYPDSRLTAEIIWWLGEYYYRHNELGVACRYFSSLVNDYPKSHLVADASYVLGAIYEQQGKYADSLAQFDKVISLGKSDMAGQAAIAIADIYVKQGKMDDAVASFREVVEKYPHLNTMIYPRLAELFSKKNEYAEALSYYRMSLEVVPVRQLPDIQFKIGELLQAQGKLEEAIGEFMKIPYVYAQNADLVTKAYLRVATIYENKENFSEAAQIYRKVVSLKVPESKYAQERLDWLTEHVPQ